MGRAGWAGAGGFSFRAQWFPHRARWRELVRAIVDRIEDREGLLTAKPEIARAPWRHPQIKTWNFGSGEFCPTPHRGNLAECRCALAR